MPVYEYQCKHCHGEFEVIQKIKDEALTWDNCPVCGEFSPVTRLISGGGSFRLKWRITPHPGKRTPVKIINGQLYDPDSYAAAKARGVFKKKKKKIRIKKYAKGAVH